MEDRNGVPQGPSPRLVFGWLYVGCAVASYGTFLLIMLSLLVADTLGLSDAALGVAFATFSVGGLASPFLAGLFADRAGPRPISLAGLGSVVVGALLAALSPVAWAFILGIFLLGAGFSMYGVMAYSWINETRGERKGLYLGLFVTAIVTGTVLAGLAVAFLLPYASSWRDFYLSAAVLALVPAVALWFLLPRDMGVPTVPKDLRAALRVRDVRWIAGLQYLVGLGGGGFGWIPIFLVEDRSLTLQAAVLAFVGASSLWGLSGVGFGRLADRGWARPMIAFGGVATGFAYLAFLLWDAVTPSILFLVLYAFLWPAGAQVPITFLGQRLGPKAQRTELGLSENLFLAGDATGAALIGFLANSWSLLWALALIPGAATLLAGVLFALRYGVRRGVEPLATEGLA